MIVMHSLMLCMVAIDQPGGHCILFIYWYFEEHLFHFHMCSVVCVKLYTGKYR